MCFVTYVFFTQPNSIKGAFKPYQHVACHVYKVYTFSVYSKLYQTHRRTERTTTTVVTVNNTILKTCRACTWNVLAAHLSPSAPSRLNKTKKTSLHWCSYVISQFPNKGIERPVMYLLLSVFACGLVQPRLTQHSPLLATTHCCNSQVFSYIRAPATRRVSVPFLLSIWIHHDRAARGISLWMSMLLSVQDGWWCMPAACSTLKSFSASWKWLHSSQGSSNRGVMH